MVLRTEKGMNRAEGIELHDGPYWGEPPSGPIVIQEDGLRYQVDLMEGQKTGFYLDQRENRRAAAAYLRGRRVLDMFCYTGAFTVYALAGGASQVLSIDSSGEALATAKENVLRNGLDCPGVEWLEADVFQALRALRDQGRTFDLIVLDPPKFAQTAAQAERAARGYKDINLNAFRLLRPGGLLFTFSCSGGVSPDLFQKIVAGAALDAGVDVKIIARMAQGADHPVALSFPEGAYLKGLVCYRG